jgi:hypothetical protein
MDSMGLSSLVCFSGRLRDERYSVMVTLRDHYQKVFRMQLHPASEHVTGHENQLPI